MVERTPAQIGRAPVATGKIRRCANVGSYNYLGFGDPDSPTKVGIVLVLCSLLLCCVSLHHFRAYARAQNDVFRAIEKYSVSACSPRSAVGMCARVFLCVCQSVAPLCALCCCVIISFIGC